MLAHPPAKVGHVSFLGSEESHTDAGLLSFVRWRASQLSGFERGSHTLERACPGSSQNFPCTFRLVPYAAFPDTRSRSLNKRERTQKRARLQPVGLPFHANTGRWGVCRIFRHFSGFEFFSAPKHFPRPPQRHYPAESMRGLRKPLGVFIMAKLIMIR